MSKNETQGHVLTIEAHASSTFSVLQIMRQLSAQLAAPGPGCQCQCSRPSQAQPRTLQNCSCRVTTPQYPIIQRMQFCSENVSPLQCQHSLVPELLVILYIHCIVLCNVSNVVLVDTLRTVSSFNAIIAAAIKCGLCVWVKNSSSILFKIFVFAWHQGSGNTGNTVQCCSGAAGGEMELQCCSARSALPAPRRTLHSAIRMRGTMTHGPWGGDNCTCI